MESFQALLQLLEDKEGVCTSCHRRAEQMLRSLNTFERHLYPLPPRRMQFYITDYINNLR